VLIADDQVASRDNLVRVFRESGYRIVTAADGQECLEKVAAERPDLVVLDVIMPKTGGLEVCRIIKQNIQEFLPVLLLSARADSVARVEGLRAGAEDYMGKPYDPDELRARVEALLRTKRRFDELRGQVVPVAAPAPVPAARAPLPSSISAEEGTSDRLTGLPNQRFLTQRLAEEFTQAEKNSEPLSIMAIDLDAFDEVNSRYGRSAGDRFLEACARGLVRACRENDVVTRAGGDEFVVVLPHTHFSGCVGIAERVWHEVRSTIVEEGGFKIGCEASLGIASYPSRDVSSPKDLLRFAHAALGRAKAEGRGRICLYQFQGYLFQPK
jgi:diguanylate cyclase (GGDEF)-like protein